MNHYYCSDGTRVTQSQIDYRLRKVYKEVIWSLNCEGCGRYSSCRAHIVPKARCKTLRKTELIWDHKNIFASCYSCNSIAENVSSAAIRKLKNFEYIKEYMKDKDPERYQKLVD